MGGRARMLAYKKTVKGTKIMLISPFVETAEEHKHITSKIPDELILADAASSVTFDVAVVHCFLLRCLSDDK